MKCIIIDDEIDAIAVMEHYVLHTPELELLHTFTQPQEALEYIQNHEIDVLFLDIQMDHLDGITFASMVPKAIKIIFCTAFSEFALDGFELEAVDYLLMPVSFSRFEKAVDKVKKQLVFERSLSQDDFLLVKTEQKGRMIKIHYDEIVYIESIGNYVVFHCLDKKITSYASLRELEGKLPDKKFIRIHKSHIVCLKNIQGLKSGFVQLKIRDDVISLSIGNTYKNKLLEMLKIN